jgi:hypothetical protein
MRLPPSADAIPAHNAAIAAEDFLNKALRISILDLRSSIFNGFDPGTNHS